MTILIFISSLNYGGAEKQAVLDANLLSKDHIVYLVTFYDGPQLKQVSKRVTYIKINKCGYRKSTRILAKFCKERSIDIIHASLFAACTISALASITSKVPVVWHFHSHEYELPIKSRLAFYFLARLPLVRKILFVNHELMEHSATFRFPLKKLGVLHNHSILNFHGHKRITNDNIIHIGYIGRAVGLKRLEYLVELIQFLLNSHVLNILIHVVGDGIAMPDIREKAKAAGIEEFFVFHGFQVNTENYYRLFDIFVNPSSEECLSIAMIDAGIMALPIVAFDVGGNDEIVLNNQTGYIVQTKEAFFQKVLNLVCNETLRLEMGQNGRIHCNAHFSEEVHQKKIISLYKEVLGR